MCSKLIAYHGQPATTSFSSNSNRDLRKRTLRNRVNRRLSRILLLTMMLLLHLLTHPLAIQLLLIGGGSYLGDLRTGSCQECLLLLTLIAELGLTDWRFTDHDHTTLVRSTAHLGRNNATCAETASSWVRLRLLLLSIHHVHMLVSLSLRHLLRKIVLVLAI